MNLLSESLEFLRFFRATFRDVTKGTGTSASDNLPGQVPVHVGHLTCGRSNNVEDPTMYEL